MHNLTLQYFKSTLHDVVKQTLTILHISVLGTNVGVE